MTTISIIKEELAFINAQLQMLNQRKADLEVVLLHEQSVEMGKSWETKSDEPIVEVQSPVEDSNSMVGIVIGTEGSDEEPVVEVPVKKEYYSPLLSSMDHEYVANTLLELKNYEDWVSYGNVSYIDIHIKITPPKEGYKVPYILGREKIFVIDAYDEDDGLLGTSEQFHMNSLPESILNILRTYKDFGKFNVQEGTVGHTRICCMDWKLYNKI